MQTIAPINRVPPRGRWIRILAPMLLLAIVLVIFGRTLRFDLTNYDEKAQLVENELVRSLHPANIARIFTSRSITSYYPVRLFSFAVDYAVWGYRPIGYHLSNVLIHAASVLLLYALIRRLQRAWSRADAPAARAVAALSAAVFAVHPVVVEPVAWIAGREELLMTFFTLLAIHARMRLYSPMRVGVDAHTAAAIPAKVRLAVLWHVCTALACAGACLSNAVGVVVPAIVLAYDVLVARRRRVGSLVRGSVYLWAIALATLVIKVAGDRIGSPGHETFEPLITPATRALIVLYNYGQNLLQLAWPRGLVLIYPNKVPTTFFSAGVLLGAGLALLTLLLLWRWRRQGVALFGLIWFLLALAPSSQLVPHHIFRADRFLYLPLAGLCIAMAAWLGRIATTTTRQMTAAGLLALIAAALAVRSILHVPVWRDTISVFTHCMAVYPNEPRAYNNRGNAYADRHDWPRALADYDRVIALAPEFARAWYNRGNAKVETGRFDDAIADFAESLRLCPDDAEALYNRGLAFAGKGDLDAAIRDYSRAIECKADFADALYNRGNVYVRRGDLKQAIADFSAVIGLGRNLINAYNNRGNAWLDLGDTGRAIADLDRAIALDSAYARAWNNRGNARVRSGDEAGAMSDYSHAISLDPRFVDALCNRSDLYVRRGALDPGVADLERAVHADPASGKAWYRLGLVRAQQKRLAQAAEAYRRALQVQPDAPAVANNLAWILATSPDDSLRNGAEAVRLAEIASRATGGSRDPSFLDTLAASYAEVGRYDDALAALQRAIDAAREQGKPALVKVLESRRVLYEQHEPYRDVPPTGAP